MTERIRESFSLAELAERFGGTVIGNGATRIRQVAPLETAGPNELSFLTNRKHHKLLSTTRAGAVLLPEGSANATQLPRIVCKNPYASYARIASLINPEDRPAPGIHPEAIVDAKASVAASAAIGAFAVIESGVEVGEFAVIGPNSFVGREARIGAHTRLHASVTIYHDCVIGDDVEVGASTTIDRGALDDTVIEEGVKLDNQIQIGHNCHIGAHTAVAGCTGIAGSTRIGKYCMLGGNAMISGHLTIADRVVVSGGTVVAKSITEPGTYTAVFPMQPHAQWLKNAALVRHLDELMRRVRDLENEVKRLGRG